METTAAGATSNSLYGDFEPYRRWHTEERQQTLEEFSDFAFSVS